MSIAIKRNFTIPSTSSIGAEANAGQYAACNIAQALVYKRAITASEVLQNYNSTKKRYGL